MSKKDYKVKLRAIDDELCKIETELQALKRRQHELIETRDNLKNKMSLEMSEELGKQNWGRSDFDWSDRLTAALKNRFGLTEFRPQQLSAINATMSKKNAIVVMPTGAGKSLCYQLPALLADGVTVVVSPLISLMEDQVMSLTAKSIEARLITSTSSKEDVNEVLNAMTDKKSPVKLIYATPERFAKSKRFMAKLQKCFAEGRLQRIAIDEVHCCSQWGHDFRPDYKFLGVLSSMFPDVPILGLTATAPSRVIMDVQNMLNIKGCLMIKSPYNRPNLFYQIIQKPPSNDECVDIFEKLLKTRYKNQSGIIYATSIKDCTDLTQGLRDRGLKVACYHANLEAEQRSSIHLKWTKKYYQAIIATVAFGMGIDKPDVRFVLHHSLSKAMESYYQESGRAGRDGQRAECIMMYRMQDVFKLSTMVFSNAGSLEHLYGMIRYCLEPNSCRRNMIAKHFDEEWADEDCNRMCDRCLYSDDKNERLSIASYCLDLYKIIRNASQDDTRLTAQKLIDSWFKKGTPKLRVDSVKVPRLSRDYAEAVVAFLIVEGYLKEDFHFTAYTTISYIKIGPKSTLVESNKEIQMIVKKFHKLDLNSAAPNDSTMSQKGQKTSKTDDSDEDIVLIETKPKSKKLKTKHETEDTIVLD